MLFRSYVVPGACAAPSMHIYVIPGACTAPSMHKHVVPGACAAPSMHIYVIPGACTAPSMHKHVVPATGTAPSMHICVVPGACTAPSMHIYASPAVPGSVIRMLPGPPGFLYFGWLSGTTLKSDFSLLFFVDFALRRLSALSGHFPGPPAGDWIGATYAYLRGSRSMHSTIYA